MQAGSPLPSRLPVPATPPRLTSWTSEAIASLKRRNGQEIYPLRFNRTVTPPTVNYDFNYWFQYFWAEVLSYNLSSGENLSTYNSSWNELLNRMYLDWRANPVPPATEADQITYLRDNLPAPDQDRQTAILEQLLRIGFKPMAQQTLLARDGAPYRVLGALDPGVSALHFPHRITTDSLPSTPPILLGFRGEGRDFSVVSSHGGAKRKVDVDPTPVLPAGIENIREPWHPFSVPAIRNEMYLRRSTGDNCLYTVISIADDIPLALGFPLIEDENIYKISKELRQKPVVKWDRSDIADASSKGIKIVLAKCKLKPVGGGDEKVHSCYFLATKSYLYTFKARNNIVNTQKEAKAARAAGDCKEQGIKGIELEDFMLGVCLYRVHLGMARMGGIYAFVRECKYYDGSDWVDIGSLARSSRFYAHHFGVGVNDTTRNDWEGILKTVFKLEEIDPRKTGAPGKTEPYFAYSSDPLVGERDLQTNEEKRHGKFIALQTLIPGPTSEKVIHSEHHYLVEVDSIDNIDNWSVEELDSTIPVVVAQAPPAVPRDPVTPGRIRIPSGLLSPALRSPESIASSLASSDFNYALSNQPVLLNGMKVIFDRPVGVYPVTLEPKEEANTNGQ
jgi:hypothetical protein